MTAGSHQHNFDSARCFLFAARFGRQRSEPGKGIGGSAWGQLNHALELKDLRVKGGPRSRLKAAALFPAPGLQSGRLAAPHWSLRSWGEARAGPDQR